MTDTVVIIPTYNNAGTLKDVLSRTLAQGLPIVVVDDGCPVLDEGFLCGIHDDAGLPSMLGKEVGKGFLEVKFLTERSD